LSLHAFSAGTVRSKPDLALPTNSIPEPSCMVAARVGDHGHGLVASLAESSGHSLRRLASAAPIAASLLMPSRRACRSWVRVQRFGLMPPPARPRLEVQGAIRKTTG
jgi:hypothetical protein